jgi:large subunit ribosomal protein L18
MNRHELHLKKNRRSVRVRAKIEGTKERPRLTVFRSNTAMFAQVINDLEGHTLCSISAKEARGGKTAAKAEKMNKTQLAEKMGGMIAEKAKKAGVEAVVFDRGRYPFHGRIKAFAEAARKAGLKF